MSLFIILAILVSASVASGCGDNSKSAGPTGFNSSPYEEVTGTSGTVTTGENSSSDEDVDSTSNAPTTSATGRNGSNSNDDRITTRNKAKIGVLLGEALGASNEYIWKPYHNDRFAPDAVRKQSARSAGREAADYVIARARRAAGLATGDAKFATLNSDLMNVVAKYFGVKVSLSNEKKGPGVIGARAALNDAVAEAGRLGIPVNARIPSRSNL